MTKQDRALSIDALKEIFVSLEEEWLSGYYNRLSLANEGAFFINPISVIETTFLPWAKYLLDAWLIKDPKSRPM